MRVSLIIPAYNEEAYIGGCLDSVLGQGFDEILVVDNASTDRTAQIAKEKGAKIVRENTKGLPAAREAGRRAAEGDLLAYIDADCQMPEEWLSRAKKIFNERPEVVSLSGPARYWDASPFQKFALAASWWLFAPVARTVVGYLLFGAHFVARKNALEEIGGFDTGITFFGEDTDLARRLSKRGTVLFKMNFYILTSARRFAHDGLFKTNLVYSMNFLWPVLFHRPFTRTHKDIRVKNPYAKH
jgi:glycosyltransferase involved in cell wall biosynthesis